MRKNFIACYVVIVAVTHLACVPAKAVTDPAAPSGLNATPGEGRVHLDWDDNIEGDLGGYNVYRSTNSGDFLGSIAGAGNSDYTDTDVVNGITYYYVVTAVDTNKNESAKSSEVSATPTDQLPPFAPEHLSASAYNEAVFLEWDENTEVDWSSYSLYRSTTSNSYDAALASNLNSSTYWDNTVSNSMGYYYVVRAFDYSGNESEKSNGVFVQIPAALVGYDLWASGWSTNIGAATNDFDFDGLNNLYEYGLAGNPTNGLAPTSQPVFSKQGNRFLYVHPQRTDDASLIYTVETTTNLISGTWSNEGYTVTGTNRTVGDLDFVTNHVEIVENEKFVRLKIDQ